MGVVPYWAWAEIANSPVARHAISLRADFTTILLMWWKWLLGVKVEDATTNREALTSLHAKHTVWGKVATAADFHLAATFAARCDQRMTAGKQASGGHPRGTRDRR